MVLREDYANGVPGDLDAAGVNAITALVNSLVNSIALKADDTEVVHDTGTETIDGAKTFSAAVTVATPTVNGHATTKLYVDTAIAGVGGGGGSPNAVLYIAPPTGTAATDTATIQAAHDALPASGGTLIMQAGYYYISSTGPVFTKRTRLIGQGAMSPDAQGVTLLVSNSTAATALTINAEGCELENFGCVNLATTPVSGAAIRLQKAHFVRLVNVDVFNYFDNISVEAGHYWLLEGCHLLSPVRYGVRIRNSDHNDSGDMLITGCWFDMTGVTRDSAAAIRWETGSGLRVVNTKINGSGANMYDIGIDIAFDVGVTAVANSADMFIQNCSIEAIGVCGIKIARAGGTFGLYFVLVQGNEFLACPTAISIGQSVNDWLVAGSTINSSTTGISILSGAGPGKVSADNIFDLTTTPIANASTSAFIDVAIPHIIADGKLFTDSTSGRMQIDQCHRRAIDFTVSATPASLWALIAPNSTGGVVKVIVTGTYNATTGFIASKEFSYTVNGSGVVTVADMFVVAEGSTQPVISVTTATNSMVVKLATTAGNNVTNGKADIEVHGLLTEMRRGA